MTKSELKRKTINGFFWSLLENVFSQGQAIIFGIILARLLSPKEFGIIGEIAIFIAVGQVFVDSGLSQALIRKQNCSHLDYSTVFWLNLIIGIIVYAIIWILSPAIASFYGNPILVYLTRISALAIIIGSLTIIQQTIIIKEVDLKNNTKISTISTFIGGVVGVVLAILGYGVWSLVWQIIIIQIVKSILFWNHNRWFPGRNYSIKSLKELFGFGSNILIISLISTLFKNVYNIVLGKNYSTTILGYYFNADKYSTIPSNTFMGMTNKVGYTVLSKFQDDNEMLKMHNRKLVHNMMFISFFVMFGLTTISKPLFSIVLGVKWLPSVILFQVLCVSYSVTPLLVVNQNIMKIKGRSDLFLKTEIIKYIIYIPIIIAGIVFGLFTLVAGILVFNWMSIVINGIFSNRLIGYSLSDQFRDIIFELLACLIPASLIVIISEKLNVGSLTLLFVQSVAYFVIVIFLSQLFKLIAIKDIKSILKDKFTIVNLKKTINR